MTDKKLLKFASDFRKGLLNGESSAMMCYAVSAPLSTILTMFGVSNELVEGEVEEHSILTQHYWLKLADGRILDATADQFLDKNGQTMPGVYLGDKPEWYLEKSK